MDRLFLDACVVFSAAYNPSSPLRALWELGDATLLASDLVIEEARRNLAVLRPERLDDLGRLSGKLEIVMSALTEVPPEAQRLPDKDLPVLLAALAGRATHLLTVDKKHFGSLFGKTVRQVLILTPGEYLNRRA
ncbi:MAG TPA: PIN domain-containing protein [Candidatus Methylomirabilis sp.]